MIAKKYTINVNIWRNFLLICFWILVALLDFTCVFAATMQSQDSLVSITTAQPIEGEPLSISVNTDKEYALKWYVEDKEVSTEASYTPTTSDYEKWIKVVVTSVYSGEALGEDSIYFSKLPVVYINTDDGESITTKDDKTADMDIQGNSQYTAQYSGDITIKVRGNSSASYPQRPYKIKLDSSTNLFGMGKSKHWVLISNYLDQSGLRNMLGSSLSQKLGLVNMDMVYVDVVINGEYAGFYELTEHIRIDDNRVDIYNWEDEAESIAKKIYKGNTNTLSADDQDALEDLLCEDLSWITNDSVTYNGITYKISDYYTVSSNITGGYLFEMSEEYDEVSKFTTAGGIKVMVNSPENIYTNDSIMSYIKEYWQNFEDAIQSKDGYDSNSVHYSQMADFDSMVSYWLTMEILGNNDAVYKSRYAYKDTDGLLTFGPAWDFDWGCGSYKVSTSPIGWKLSSGTLWKDFIDDPYFQIKASEKYWAVRAYLEYLIEDGGYIDETIEYLSEAGMLCDVVYPATKHGAETRRTFNTDASILKTYLKNRIAWLDEVFVTENNTTAAMNISSSTYPYTKSSDELAIEITNAEVDTISNNAPADGLIRSSDGVNVNVAVSDQNTMRISVYVNGLIQNNYDVIDNVCTFSLPKESLTEEIGTKNIISLIGYDDLNNITYTNYTSVIVVPDSYILGTPYTIKNEIVDYDVDVSHIVINQAYGGSSDGYASHNFIELYNPTDIDIDLSSWSLQYRSSNDGDDMAAWSKLDLTGTIPAHSSYLVRCSAIASPNKNAIMIDDYDQEWNQVIHNKGICILLIANQDLLDAETDIYDNDNHIPLISDYVDMYSVSGNDTDTEKKLLQQKAPYSETAASTVQSKKKTIRRVEFKDTDDNTVGADFEVIDYSFDVDSYIDWISPRSSLDGAWDYKSNIKPTYSVAYECGENSTTVPDEKYGLYETIVKPENPMKEGYTFAGWYTDEALTNAYDFENQDPPTGDIILYAMWEINTYTISYDTNDGNAIPDVTYVYQAVTSAPEEIPTKEGYTFVDWYKDASLTEVYIFDKMPAMDVTVYAKWEVNTYNVTYQTNGGSAISDDAYVYGEDMTAPVNPIREGYTFTDWYEDEDMTKVYTFGNMPSNDIVLYAGWAKNVYKVVYVDNDGTVVNVQEISHGDSSIAPDGPSHNGYTFLGWTTTADYVTGNMIIIATYKKVEDQSGTDIVQTDTQSDANSTTNETVLQDANTANQVEKVTISLNATYKKAVANKKAKTVITKKVKSVTLYTKKLKTAKLSAIVTGTNDSVQWYSSNLKVVKVSKQGKVTAVGKGTAYITAEVDGVCYRCKFTVKKTKITFAQKTTSVMMQLGKKQSVGATVVPQGIVTYKTSDKSIVSISKKGVMKAQSVGTATITVKANGIKKKLKVIVQEVK